MTLAVCLFIIAGLTAFSTLLVITSAKQAGSAVAVTILNAFCITVEIMAAFRLMHGG